MQTCYSIFMDKIVKGIFFLALVGFPVLTWAGSSALDIVTQVRLSSEGEVFIELTLKNVSNKTLYQIAPVFHFHHAISSMPIISSLKSGESRTLNNTEHPRVLQVGRYPLVAIVKYKPLADGDFYLVQTHMGSFDYRESLRSAIHTDLESESGNRSALLKIFLENRSDSFKNLRLMLLLPVGLKTETFGRGVLGFTIRSREKKKIEIPITREKGTHRGQYTVYFMTEYGEMQKHFSDEVSGTISFESF